MCTPPAAAHTRREKKKRRAGAGRLVGTTPGAAAAGWLGWTARRCKFSSLMAAISITVRVVCRRPECQSVM